MEGTALAVLQDAPRESQPGLAGAAGRIWEQGCYPHPVPSACWGLAKYPAKRCQHPLLFYFSPGSACSPGLLSIHGGLTLNFCPSVWIPKSLSGFNKPYPPKMGREGVGVCPGILGAHWNQRSWCCHQPTNEYNHCLVKCCKPQVFIVSSSYKQYI